MSNIRDYMKEKEKRQGTAQTVGYKEKIRSHRLTVFYRTVLGIVLVVVLLFFGTMQWRAKVFTEMVEVSSSEITMVQGTTAKNLDGNILFYSKDGANCIDTKGKQSGTVPLKCSLRFCLFPVQCVRLEIIMVEKFM